MYLTGSFLLALYLVDSAGYFNTGLAEWFGWVMVILIGVTLWLGSVYLRQNGQQSV